MWARDFLAEHPADQHIINDSWTPSGHVHIGSFRSLIIHDVLNRLLVEAKKPVRFIYGFDDFDPLDGIPDGVEMDLTAEMGKPLNRVPAPGKGYKNFAEYFIDEFKRFHTILGIKPSYYLTSELYSSGKFNPAIQKVLDQADQIRSIYAEVSGSQKEKNWYPLQVVCPNCSKLGSTMVSSWDGKQVGFQCRQDLVPWAVGCGYEGRTSPFDGLAKMPWRVEWAAKWDLFGVTIESAGKDHASRGGSYDVSERILKDVFGKSGINRLPHEFFLVGGKKMGSTKQGLGVTPENLLEVVPPELFRFLVVRNRPQLAIEIDLKSEMIPRLYDEYDRCQAAYLEKTDPDLADYFAYSQVSPAVVGRAVQTRFSSVVNLLQLPSLRSELERPETRVLVPLAKVWLEKYAPEATKFLVQDRLPGAARTLTPKQKQFLISASKLLGEKDGEKLQAQLYELSKEVSLPAGEAFQAIYLSMIGKTSGPRAGMLLASQNPNFVSERFLEAAQ